MDDNFVLKQRVMREHEMLEHEKAALSQIEYDLEVGSERSFNMNSFDCGVTTTNNNNSSNVNSNANSGNSNPISSSNSSNNISSMSRKSSRRSLSDLMDGIRRESREAILCGKLVFTIFVFIIFVFK